MRVLCCRYHPDKVDGDKEEARKRFTEINEAYEALSDPERRRLHDIGEYPPSEEDGW
jgi:curved DNA-binding protein CbpA